MGFSEKPQVPSSELSLPPPPNPHTLTIRQEAATTPDNEEVAALTQKVARKRSRIAGLKRQVAEAEERTANLEVKGQV